MYRAHINSQCQGFFEHSIHSPSRVTLREVLEKEKGPITPAEKVAAKNIISRLMAENEDTQFIQLPTRGQPLSLLPVKTCRVKSSEACRKTVTNRSRTLTELRDHISGGDSYVQLRSEVKALSKEEREEVLKGAGLPIEIPPNHALAMKADLALPWSKMREISRWLKSFHVSVGSEIKQRFLAKDILGDNLVVTKGAFSAKRDGGGEEIQEVPFGYVPNLIRKAADVIDHHMKTPAGLTWHEVIPQQEIWLKLGGDKGHGSFKLNLQLCNILAPNSQKNTLLVSWFMAGDSYTNLHTCLDMYREHVTEMQGMALSGSYTNLHTCLDMYREHVTEMQGMALSGYTIKIFLTGDYEFLCRMYGLSGASGRHCCLWCTAIYSDIQKPLCERGRSPSRSLATLEEDHKQFLEKRGGDINRAKEFNNVIRPPILGIPLDMICLPGLHMTLGIYERLWELLQDDCTELDLLLACHTAAVGAGNTFQEYAAALQTKRELENKLKLAEQRVTALDQLVTLFSLCSPNPAQDQNVKNIREASSKALLGVASVIKEISEFDGFLQKKFKPRDGPYFQSLFTSIKKLGVARQIYHGGSFVGNHVHKLLQTKSIDTLMSGIEAASATVLQMKEHVHNTTTKFRKVFLLFSRCDSIYNGRVITHSTLLEFEHYTREFLAFYREEFTRSKYSKASILPKMHLLEDHMQEWLGRHYLGAGLMGEQGAESIHAHLNTLEDRYKPISNAVERMRETFKMYNLKTEPSLLAIKPVKGTRKRKRPE